MAEQRADQEKGAVLIAVNNYWNDPERRLLYSDRVLKGYIETFYRYLFFQVDVVVDFTLKDFIDKLKEFTTCCRKNGMNRIAVVLYGHGGIDGGKEYILTNDFNPLGIAALEEELHSQLPDDNKYLFIDACRNSVSVQPQPYVFQAKTSRTTVIRSTLLFKMALSNAWSECFAMNLRKQGALTIIVNNVDDNMKEKYTDDIRRKCDIPVDEGDQKSDIRSKGTSDDPSFRGEARASNQERIRELTPSLQRCIKAAEGTFKTLRAELDLPSKPILSFLDSPPDDRSNLTGPGLALSSAQGLATANLPPHLPPVAPLSKQSNNPSNQPSAQDQQTMPPSTTPVEHQRTLALSKAHKKLKRFYTKQATWTKQVIKLALVERPSKVDKTKKDVMEFLEATAHGIDRYTRTEKNIEYETILTGTDSDSGKRVLISGSPGSGKTTLARQLCRDLCSANQYQLVLFTELKAFRSYTNKKNKEASLLTLLKRLSLPEPDSLCSMIENEEGRGVAIILDGYDEISDASCKTMTEWVSEVFCKECLEVSECDVFITTRPSQLSQLAKFASVHMEILGFSRNDIEGYIKAYDFKGTPGKAEEVIRRLTRLPLVLGLCSNPRVLEIACKVLKHRDEEPLPANLSGIFLRYVCYQLEVDLTQRKPPDLTQRKPPAVKIRIKDLLNVSEELFPGFYPLCSLAYHCCLRQQLLLEYDELGEVKNFINSRGSVYNLLSGEEVDMPSEILCVLYLCDHKTVMEALAAVHIAYLLRAEQKKIWDEWFTAPHMAQVWMMYCGLTGLKSVDLRRLCSLTMSERSREVVKDLGVIDLVSGYLHHSHDDKLVMVSLFEASNDEEAKWVLPNLLKNIIRGYVESQHDVLCLAYSIDHHPHLSRVWLRLPDDCSELDLQPLTTSLKNVKAFELRCDRMEPVLNVQLRAVEGLSLFHLIKTEYSCQGLGDALRDCHCLRSLTINVSPNSALWTELDSVLTNNRLTEFHLKNTHAPPRSMEILKNLLVHLEKCSLEMPLTNHQLFVLLSGLKRADKLKELDLHTKVLDPEVNPDQWLVTCAEVEKLVATHPHLVKVDVKIFKRTSDLLNAVAKGAIKNKNITHLGLGVSETHAVHPLLCSPSADHITSIRTEYWRGHDYDDDYDDDDDDDDDGGGGDDDDDAWSKGMIAGPMARQTCHLHLRDFTSASLGLLLSSVNTATKLKDLSLEVTDYGKGHNLPVDVHAVETAFMCCNLRKLRIQHNAGRSAQWYRLYSAILNGLAANTTTQVDSCLSLNAEEITRHLSQQTLQRFEVVRKKTKAYFISRDPSCPSDDEDTPTKHQIMLFVCLWYVFCVYFCFLHHPAGTHM